MILGSRVVTRRCGQALVIIGRRLVSTANNHVAPKIELRDYQQASIDAVLSYLARGERRLGLSLATGSGKTVIFSHLIDHVQSTSTIATRTLVLAHRRELVEQAARHCRNVYPNKTIEIEMGSLQASGTADITVASVASINRRLEKYDASTYKLLIVDEAHHITAQSYSKVIAHFGIQKDGPVALVGVSATFSRADGISLGSAIDHIVYHKDYLEMIEEEYLAGLIITTVQTGVDLSSVSVRQGDFVSGELSKAVNTPATNDLTVRSWLAKAEGRNSTLVFCVDIAHVQSLTSAFQARGIDARFVTGDTKPTLRAETLQAFRNAEFPVLLNCSIFTEGTDIPNIDCVLLARPTRSRNLLIQMIGRGLRKHSSKADCHIIDMVGTLRTGIVTMPTLFGLDPQEVLDAADRDVLTELAQVQKAWKKQRSNDPTSVSFTDYDDVLDFIKDNGGPRLTSPYAWVQVDGRHFLANSSGDYLTIHEDHSVTITRKLHGSKSPFMTPRVIAKTESTEAALAAADNWAKNNFPHSYILKWATWRKTPASEGQLKFLRKIRPDIEHITKGEASEWITKLRHGAGATYQKGFKQSQKQVIEQEKDAKRARVGLVGPVE